MKFFAAVINSLRLSTPESILTVPMMQSVQTSIIKHCANQRHLLWALTIASSTLAASPAMASEGVILFGPSQSSTLSYCDNNNQSNAFNTYYLEIKRQPFAVDEIQVEYPANFDGKLSKETEDIKIRLDSTDCRNGKEIPVQSVSLDSNARRFTIQPKAAIQPNTRILVVFSNAINPSPGGFFQFDGYIRRVDRPLRIFVGSWMMTFN
ncbi:MAG: DUF2808 domain-containing protein [Pseudanabaena sp. ELA607]|jgi:hypothetical protein